MESLTSTQSHCYSRRDVLKIPEWQGCENVLWSRCNLFQLFPICSSPNSNSVHSNAFVFNSLGSNWKSCVDSYFCLLSICDDNRQLQFDKMKSMCSFYSTVPCSQCFHVSFYSIKYGMLPVEGSWWGSQKLVFLEVFRLENVKTFITKTHPVSIWLILSLTRILMKIHLYDG